jgi:hypothetical protein
MNGRTFAKLGTLVILFGLMLGGVAQATTYYVNVQTGLDTYDGLSAVVGAFPSGPKLTITNAIAAASSGDTISVDIGNSGLYDENVAVGNITLVFKSTGGTPHVKSWTLNNTLTSPGNRVTFLGPFQFNNGLTLTAGNVIGAGNLTVGGAVTRTAGTVDAQLLYTGTVNFVYNNTAAMTTGLELPPSSDQSTLGSLTMGGGGFALTLNESKTMKGVLTTSALLTLGSNTLTINNTGAATHTIGAQITSGASGGLVFNMSSSTAGAANVAVNGTAGATNSLPNITANTTSAAQTLTINTTTHTGSLTANAKAGISGGAGAITNVAGNVTDTGTGTIVLASAVTITGNVVLNTAFTLGSSAISGTGGILFSGDNAVTVKGSVTNSTSYTGTTTVANTYAGLISFGAATALTTLGSVINSSSSQHVNGTGGSFTSNGEIIFAATTGNVVVAGGFTNSTSYSSSGSSTATTSGQIIFAGLTTGTVGTAAARTGAVVNTSTSTANSDNGSINFDGAGTAAGTFYGTSVSSTGATGGYIRFGNASFDVNGSVTNARTSTLATGHIQIGSAAGGAANVTIGGNLINSGASSMPINVIQNGTITTTGRIENSGSGTLSFPNATNAASLTFGGLTVSNGTLSFAGSGGAITAPVTVNGNVSVTAGTLDFGTGARSFVVRGTTNTLSGPTSAPTYLSTGTTLEFQNPAPTAQQAVTLGLASIWRGSMNVNNGGGLPIAIIFTGGDLRVLGNVSFTAGVVELDNTTLFIGGQGTLTGAGNFTNTSGYQTVNDGFITMQGNATQTVSGAGTFGNFEQDVAPGSSIDYSAGTVTFTGNFGLTNGLTIGATNIVFSNTTTPPTISRNNGQFSQTPNWAASSDVNVVYIGGDKTVANELPPPGADRLNDLRVATTNGALTAGRGTVDVNVATTVKGNITVNAGQALRLDGVSLTMNGPMVTLNGDIANNAAGSQLILNAATGTTITGSGVLPDILVNAGSVGNAINGSTGLATGLLGADGVRSPTVDDINPGATGGITFAGGAASSLTVAFGTANASTGAHLASITTATGATLTLGANLTEHSSGNLNHVAGTIDCAGFTYTHNGTAPAITGGALTTSSTGSLAFRGGNTTLALNTSDVTIGANVVINLGAAGNTFTLSTATVGNLIISGTLTLTQGTLVLGSTGGGGLPRNLTLTGSTFSIGSNGSVASASDGTLRLNATTPPLTMSFTGTPTIANLQVSNGVTLAGSGTQLNVAGSFLHDGGNLDFSTRTLNITGSFTRTAGTYSASATAVNNATGALTDGGWLVIAGTTFKQGTGFSIPNLRIAALANLTVGTAADFTVTGAFDLQNGGTNKFTHTVSGSPRLNIANNAIVRYVSGALDVSPVFAGSITLVAAPTVNPTAIPKEVWPPTPTNLVTNFLVAAGAPATTVQLVAGTFTVNSVLNLIQGTLDLNTNKATLAVANNATIRRQQNATILALGTGAAITFGTGLSVIYEPSAGTVAATVPNNDMNTGPELPATVVNLTFTRIAGAGDASVNIASNVMVTGTLTVSNDININRFVNVGPVAPGVPFPVPTGTVTLTGNVVINRNVTFSPWGGSPLTFASSGDQTITMDATRNIDAILLNQQRGIHHVTFTGGNLSLGTVIFQNGLLMAGDNTVILPGATQGFVRNVTSGNYSHVVGNLQKTIIQGASGRFEYPIGTAGSATDTIPRYRPAAITFLPTNAMITTAGITFKHVDSDPNPGGVNVGFPIDAGGFVSLTGHAHFYWLATSTVGLGPSQTFDLEFTAEGFTTYQNGSFGINQLRIVRRFDGSEEDNKWELQGGANYVNFITNVPVPGTPVVRVIGSSGGIDPAGVRFSIGTGLITDVTKQPNEIPTEYNLSQNYPNPFNPSTLINFDLPKQSVVTLEIYDVLGQKVKTLVNGETMDPGYYKITWNGTNQYGSTVSSGIYFYRIVADKFTSLKKMMFLK